MRVWYNYLSDLEHKTDSTLTAIVDPEIFPNPPFLLTIFAAIANWDCGLSLEAGNIVLMAMTITRWETRSYTKDFGCMSQCRSMGCSVLPPETERTVVSYI